jgi:hypothetical protein
LTKFLKETALKHKTLITATVVFFILINTTEFWQERLGILAMPAAVALFLFYIFLLFVLVQQLYLLIKERFQDWQRILGTAFLVTVILLAYFKPRGVVNFKRSSRDVLVAKAEGPGGCTTTLMLQSNGGFIEQNQCFGNTQVHGKYTLQGDTIYFSEVDMGSFENSYYEFAIIKKGSAKKPGGGTLTRYQNKMDKDGNVLPIIKNQLLK